MDVYTPDCSPPGTLPSSSAERLFVEGRDGDWSRLARSALQTINWVILIRDDQSIRGGGYSSSAASGGDVYTCVRAGKHGHTSKYGKLDMVKDTSNCQKKLFL